MTDLRVAILAHWAYPEPLEEFFARGFEALGATVLRWRSPPVAVGDAHIDGDADLVFCFKTPCPKAVRGKRVLYFPDLTTRFEQEWTYLTQIAPVKHFTGGVPWDAVCLPHDEPRVDPAHGVFHVPVGYDPGFHYPYQGPGVADMGIPRDIPVLFVGTWRPEREWVRQVPGASIWGNDWGGKVQPVYGANKQLLHARAKVVLNFHYPGEWANMRLFEAMAYGCAVATDCLGPFLWGGVAQYPTPQDCVARIGELIADEPHLARLRKEAIEAVKPHTYQSRCAEILRVVNLA